jgi:cobalt-zinc-cadmium efflux system protein
MGAGTPSIDFIRVKNDLLAFPAMAEVNDLHIGETGAEQRLLSAHLVSGEDSPDHEAIIRTVQEMLLHKYGINHTTLQILPFSAGDMEHCSHCN